jgi:hypothetical protein
MDSIQPGFTLTERDRYPISIIGNRL